MFLQCVSTLASRLGIGPRRSRGTERLPLELRRQFLDALYAGRQFRTILHDLGLTSNQVWGSLEQMTCGERRSRPH